MVLRGVKRFDIGSNTTGPMWLRAYTNTPQVDDGYQLFLTAGYSLGISSVINGEWKDTLLVSRDIGSIQSSSIGTNIYCKYLVNGRLTYITFAFKTPTTLTSSWYNIYTLPKTPTETISFRAIAGNPGYNVTAVDAEVSGTTLKAFLFNTQTNQEIRGEAIYFTN